MSAAEDRLEILMGKLLDGEISPVQQRLLDRELEQDARARELLEQMRSLHECGREVVGRELSGGAAPAEIFERAWKQNRGSVWHRIIHIGGPSRFAVGLAAGLLLGLMLHFVRVGGPTPPPEPPGNPPVAREPWDPVIREVEWYGFTDRAGNQWLIEGFREGMARPASYHGDL